MSNTDDGLVAEIGLVVEIPLRVVALLDPHRCICDFFSFEVSELEVTAELNGHVGSCGDSSNVLEILPQERVSASWVRTVRDMLTHSVDSPS